MNAAVYARFSSDNQRTESIDAQIRDIRDYAEKNNITIVCVYTDEAKSAKTDERPQFQKMLRDAECKLFDTVLIHKFDRFARNKYDSVIHKHRLKALGITVISVKEKLDDSPESIILESMLEGMAEYYSANLAREVMKGMRENALKCKHTGGKPPFGFDIDSQLNYVINERESIAVQRMFDDYASGKSYKEIIRWLNEGGYTTKYGKPFHKTSLNMILKNEKYIGRYTFNMYKRVKRDGKKVNEKHSNDDMIIVDNGIPAIISKDLFESVQKQMNINMVNMRSMKAKEEYLLSGLLYCGLCDSKMNGARRYAGRNKSLYITYQCSGRKNGNECRKKEMGRDIIESIVLDHLENNVFTDDFILKTATKMYNKYLESETTSGNNLKIYEDALKKINAKIDNIVEAIASGMYHASMKIKMDELEKQKNEHLMLIVNEKENSYNEYTLQGVIDFLKQGQGISNKTFREKKILINTFISKIVIYDDEILLHLKISNRSDNCKVQMKNNARTMVDRDVLMDVCASPPFERLQANPFIS